MNDLLQAPEPMPEPPQADVYRVDVQRDLCGLLIGDKALMARIGISKSAFYRFKRQGRYEFLLVHPQPTDVSTYCGTLVQSWLDGAAGERRTKPMARTHW